MKCPACSADGPDGAPECAACGVNYGKWEAKRAKAAEVAAAAADAPPPEPPKSTLGTTLSILAVLCVGVYFAYDVARSHLDPPVPEKSGVVVKPEAYKGQIMALEAILYKDSPATQVEAGKISEIALRIAGTIMEKHPANPFIRDAVGDIMTFASEAGSSAEGMAMPPTAKLDWTRRWEKVRGRRFEKAPWFHASVTKADGPPPDFEKAAQRLLTTANVVKGLLEALPAEFEPFGNEGVDRNALKGPKADENQDRLDAWRAWVPVWQARVDQSLSGFPSPDEMPPALEFSYDTLVRTAQEIRFPPNPGPGVFVSAAELNELYVPDKRMRHNWVKNLSNWIDDLPDAVVAARKAKDAPPPKGQQ